MIDGDPLSELVLLGRDPGWQEIREGRPFVGAAGHVLNAALRDAYLPREKALLCNVVNKRPSGDNWDAHAAGDVVDGLRVLEGLLGRVPRRLIVGLGAQAFWVAATGEAPPREKELAKALQARFGGSITELRGYTWDGPWGKVLPAVHPAFITRTWLPWRATLAWDLKKAKRLLAGHVGAAGLTPLSCAVAPGEGARAVTRYLLEGSLLAVDSEENPDACVAFSHTPSEGHTFPLESCWEQVAELLASPIPKVLQNAQYDLTRFKRLGLVVGGPVHDLMLLWHATEPLIAGKAESGGRETQKSLRFLASVFTNEPYWKNYAFESPEDKWKLCATDARVTLEIWEQLYAAPA